MSRFKKARVVFVLHTHLPFIKEPDVEEPVEETWFFEAVVESYVPLIKVFEELIEKKIPYRLVLSLSPTLLEMLEDPYLMDRLNRYLDKLSSLLLREVKRTKLTVFNETVRFYEKRLENVKDLLRRKKIITLLKEIEEAGHLELITTAATHAYLPLFSRYPEVVWLQVKTGLEIFKKQLHLKECMKGFWLPECGYGEGLFSVLKKARIDWTVLEGHAIAFGNPSPFHGIFRPVLSPEGIIFFGRDAETCMLVWSKERGYPGNPWYRDFYSDICYELTDEEWRLFRRDGLRHHTGLKYYRITGKKKKMPYIREKALRIAALHAEDFVKRLELRAEEASSVAEEPVIVLAFDTELFGHWWFEGPEWLQRVLELIAGSRNLNLTTPAFMMAEGCLSGLREVSPLPSSWGEGGFNSMWVSRESSAYLRAIYRAIEEAPPELFSSSCPSLSMPSALREFLLMQSSDFLFMLRKDEMARLYGERRLRKALEAFYRALS